MRRSASTTPTGETIPRRGGPRRPAITDRAATFSCRKNVARLGVAALKAMPGTAEESATVGEYGGATATMNPLSPGEEAARRRARVAAGETDWDRWLNADSYEQFWSDRSVAAGALCYPGEWICDIGCGRQGLRATLPLSCVYLPADLHRWDSAVEFCDLNAGRLPNRHLARCDVVTLLGVIEYINDLPHLFRALARRSESIVTSYNCSDLAEVDREGFGWVNGFTTTEVLQLMGAAGFRPARVKRFGEMEILVRAHNSRFGAMRRLRRRAARLLDQRP